MRSFQSKLLRTLEGRGAIKDCSDLEGLDAMLASGQRISVYAGFDPTADSLHVGHLATLSVLRDFAAEGHRCIAVIGTATAMVGDPTGRTEARPLLSREAVMSNCLGVGASISRAVSPHGDSLEIRRNGDWTDGLSLLGFLRDVGRVTSVGRLLSMDSMATRLAGDGLSFLELAYPLIQANDFLTLSREVGPLVQVGGSDQWGNIVAGLDLIRRSGGSDAFALTHPLLTRSDGTKMGKTAGGAVWLNADRMTDFDFFQFWRTLPDEDFARVGALVGATVTAAEPAGGLAEERKEEVAFEMTARIRGSDSASAARMASRSRGTSAAGLPVFILPKGAEADLVIALVAAGLAETRSAARRLASQGGVRVNGVQRSEMVLRASDYQEGTAVISAGKTRHAAVRAVE